MGKSFLKFRIIRSLCKNIWPTRTLTPKQKFLLSKMRKKKLSPFGVKMMEKRTISALYGGVSGTHEKKLRKRAEIFPGKTGENFVSFLEQRLDSMVFRMNICSTFRTARQLILHKKVYVNHQCVTIPSYQVQPGDILRIAPYDSQTFQKLALHALSFFQKNSPEFLPRKPFHLEINYKTLQAVYLYPPQILFYPCHISLFNEPLTSSEFLKKISKGQKSSQKKKISRFKRNSF
jgi:ribosomal protein S4